MRKRKMTRLLAAALAVVMLTFAWAPAAQAEEAPSNIVYVVLDGEPVDFVDTYAMIINDYTYVPVTKIIEILTGATPQWDPATKQASFWYEKKFYQIYQNQKGIYIDGQMYPFETGPEIRNDRIMIPLRMMTDALGLQIEWDGQTRTVKMTSPQAAQADIITVFPRKAEVSPNAEASIKVTGNGACAKAEIKDSAGKTVATGSNFTTVGDNRAFMLTFIPAAAGKYRAYVADASGNSTGRSLEVEIELAATATVNRASLSTSTAVLNESVAVTAYATEDTARVRLISDDNDNDIVETTSYTTSGGERVFKFDWRIRESYYSSLSRASAKVYAYDSSGTQGGYSTITVNIDKDGPSIYDYSAGSTSISTNASTKISVSTSSNVSSVSFSVTSGSGSLERSSTTSYVSESGNRRYWENTFYSGSTAGTSKILITAKTASGASKEATLTITSSGGSDFSIKSYQLEGSAVAKSTVTFLVYTGTGAERVGILYDGGENYSSSPSGYNDSQKWWYVSFTPQYDGYATVEFRTYDSGGSVKETKSHSFNVTPAVSP